MDKYKYWLDQIEQEEKQHREARKMGMGAESIYLDEEKKKKFNILWSNVDTIHGAILGRTPRPDVRRRFLSDNKVERDAAIVIERALSYSLDQYDIKGTLDRVVNDHLAPGYGIPRVHYKPYMSTVMKQTELEPREEIDENGEVAVKYYNDNMEVSTESVQVQDEGAFMYQEEQELIYQEVYCSHIPWKHFHWQEASSWELVNWCAIELILDRQALIDEFGEEGKEVPLNYHYQKESITQSKEDYGTHALVYEIFDKRSKKIRYLAEGMNDFIKVIDDDLNLENFYPFPQPLWSNLKSGTLIPKPDYFFYQEQAEELEIVTKRINALTKQLKYRGFYDGMFKELGNVSSQEDGDFYPLTDFSAKLPEGDIRRLIASMPLEEIQKVIIALEQRRESIKQTIYEITGISDIVRGSTKASETLGAQQMKQQNAGMRISTKQAKVERMIRDLLRIKAELIAEKFTQETLTQMTGIEVTPEIMDLIGSDILRAYKIDVETDSTIFEDAQLEQKNRVEVLGAITQFMQQAFPAVQAGFISPEIAKEMVLFGIRSFKSGRQLEDAIEQFASESQAKQAPNQPSQPNPGDQAAGGLQGNIGMAPEGIDMPSNMAQLFGQ